jgi:Papain-like cysteine protease AvrRpt2
MCIAAAGLTFATPATPATSSGEKNIPEKARFLDVPYVPQSEALCGGAAVAMVLRYWGDRGALAEDFAPLVEPGKDGIRADVLVEAVRARGWIAHPIAGTPADIQEHLGQRRPIIVRIETGAGSHHYVVIVAWTAGWVVFHDPAVRPYSTRREQDFDAAWSKSDRFALVILPPPHAPGEGQSEPAAIDSAPHALNECDAIVEEGVLEARNGNVELAEERFQAARALCPESAAPVRELAGLRFRSDQWVEAARFAESAVAIDENDSHAWRLLASARFLAGDDVEGALEAWNHLSEPRADLTRIDGLSRTRYRAVAGQVDLKPGRLLTARAFVLARRRLEEIPALAETRLSLRPQQNGTAQVNVALLEHPLLFQGRLDVGGAAIRALVEREVIVDVASPTGSGELLTGGWRWWENRPSLSVGLAVPIAGGWPGILRAEGVWDRQTYAAPASIGTTASQTIREERRRSALSFSNWIGPHLRVEVGAAWDRWTDLGQFLALEGTLETRLARDRVGLRGKLAGWESLEAREPFAAWSAHAWWRPQSTWGEGWTALMGISEATTNAPLAVWSGAGTGHGRDPFLRAHSLLDDGVLNGRVFGRSLVHGSIERLSWVWMFGPVRLGWVFFVDGARAWDLLQSDQVPWQADGGIGLRLGGLGRRGQLRIDAAAGIEDGASEISVGWQVP